MYFSDALGVVIRRWRIVVVAAVLMAGAIAAVIVVVPTQYQASGEVLLLPPSISQVGARRTNPYMNLPGGVTFTSSLIASGATQPSVARELARAGFDSEYSVSVVPGTGPLVVISVKNDDPVAALALRDELIVRIEAELKRVQDAESVPDDQRITARRFNTSSMAEVLAGSKLRALGALGALGVVLTALAVFGAERFSRLRATQGDDSRPVSAGTEADTSGSQESADDGWWGDSGVMDGSEWPVDGDRSRRAS